MTAATEDTGKQGFASMDEEEQRKIASEGGQAQGQENNPANFANDTEKAKEAGEEGGKQSESSTNDE